MICASVQDSAWLSAATAHFDENTDFRPAPNAAASDFRTASDTAAAAAVGQPEEHPVSELSIEGRSVSAPVARESIPVTVSSDYLTAGGSVETPASPAVLSSDGGDDVAHHDSGRPQRQSREDDVTPPQQDDVIRREAEDRVTPLHKHGVEEVLRHADDNNKENGGSPNDGRGMSNAVPFVRRARSEKSPTSGTGLVSLPSRPHQFLYSFLAVILFAVLPFAVLVLYAFRNISSVSLSVHDALPQQFVG